MRILIAATDYQSFIKQLYERSPNLETASFEEQSRVRENALFGAAGFYAQNLVALGHVAAVSHPNNFFLQAAWARQHGMAVPENVQRAVEESSTVAWLKRRLRPYKFLFGPIALRMSAGGFLSEFEREVLQAQVEEFRPDVILNQDIQVIDSDLVRTWRRPGRFIIAHIGVDPPPGLDTNVYNLGISQIPWVVDFFRRKGLAAEHHHLGFEPQILDRLGLPPEKDVDVSFVGGLGAAHGKRVSFLEAIARQFRLALWVPNLKGIPSSSPLHACRKGEVYGREMFETLRRSRITLNSHINVARGSAGNMRLFEATGVGMFLLTDNLYDLPTLFEPGKEVAVYDLTQDCIDKIRYYLKNEGLRDSIAAAGQSRTLKCHTYHQRASEILGYVAKYAN